MHMNKFIVTIAEGIEKITESGVFRKLLLLPENVGIKTCEMGILMLHHSFLSFSRLSVLLFFFPILCSHITNL